MDNEEKHWEEITLLANQLFDRGDYEKALLDYKRALKLVEKLNEDVQNCLRLKIPFMQMYIISCNNLAYTYEELGQLDKATGMFKRAVYYLLHLQEEEHLNKNELYTAQRRAVLTYTDFIDKNNIQKQEKMQLLEQLKLEASKTESIK
ncbi:tetratricopeptide repeat protein [Pseudopedobacter beijingensis]|uniref:Tetratricopeptide repeat protein n=1 Tax=Pseudopedobacter beijingensis TaxID=1207056 RepID=A0ABW4ICI3_9SPHI